MALADAVLVPVLVVEDEMEDDEVMLSVGDGDGVGSTLYVSKAEKMQSAEEADS